VCALKHPRIAVRQNYINTVVWTEQVVSIIDCSNTFVKQLITCCSSLKVNGWNRIFVLRKCVIVGLLKALIEMQKFVV
jgi:hypothetical protein